MKQQPANDVVGSVHLRPAAHDDLPAILQLLETCQLPTGDVPAIVESFVTARTNEALVGIIALEHFGAVGFLRSLAVAPPFRGRSVASALCEQVLRDASRHGVRDVYLLTTDAAAYFTRRGFLAVDRARAPDAIMATRQFGELCPTSATLMHVQVDTPVDGARH